MPKIDLYSIFRPLMRIALRVYFKKIYIINEHHLPLGKKALYTLNHPTSFVDPMVLATQTSPYLHFLIRGDVFKKDFAKKLLNGIHGIPIFRRSDTSDSKNKNKETFDRVSDVLHRNESVMVMPEGSTDIKRRLRPFKKGFAHMAFHYRNKYNMDDLYIVPVSLSFSDPTRFRSVVHAHFSKPLLLSDYIADYDNDASSAINKLKSDLYDEMRANIVHIDKDEDLDLVDRGIKMIHRSYRFTLLPVKDKPRELLDLERSVSETVNGMDAQQKKDLTNMLDSYEESLSKNNTVDRVVASPISFNPLQLIFNILIAPLALAGYVMNFLPLFGGNKLAHKLMRRDEFICSVKLGASTIFYLIYGFLMFLILSLVFSIKAGLVALLALPVLGLLYLYFRGAWKRNITALRNMFINKETKEQLSKKRSEILAHFAS